MNPPLPNPRDLVTSLLSSVPAASPGQNSANPLRDLAAEASNIFLTLHVLFPEAFLPALDLLDRELVTRLICSGPIANDFQRPDPERAPHPNLSTKPTQLYLIRSAQLPSTRTATHAHPPSYREVRLAAWTCSCPAFAFAAFPAAHETKTSLPGVPTPPTNAWTFGGLTLGGDLPVCKHLLACVLVERCGLFAQCVEEREVSVEELAGWAAGWGD